jgi:hypothetical protein
MGLHKNNNEKYRSLYMIRYFNICPNIRVLCERKVATIKCKQGPYIHNLALYMYINIRTHKDSQLSFRTA